MGCLLLGTVLILLSMTAFLRPATAADRAEKYYQELQARCRQGLVLGFPPILPYELVEAGYCDLVPDYLSLLDEMLESFYIPDFLSTHYLHLALATKQCAEHRSMVVDYFESRLAAEWRFDFQVGACYVALGVVGGPVPERLLREAVTDVEERQPRVQASLALALHFVGHSETASRILDKIKIIPDGSVILEDSVRAAKAFVESDVEAGRDVGPADKLRGLFELADGGFGGVGRTDWLIDVTEGPWDRYHDFARLASMGYLVLTKDGDLMTKNLPFEIKLNPEDLDFTFMFSHLAADNPEDVSLNGPLCRLIVALGDTRWNSVLRRMLDPDQPRLQRIGAERALILLGEALDPEISRETVRARRGDFAKAWIRDHTIGFVNRTLRRKDSPRETFDVRYECQYAIRALGDSGAPADIALLEPIAMSRGGAYSQEAKIAVIKIIRRHNLSGLSHNGR
jgi:hypothetical protein